MPAAVAKAATLTVAITRFNFTITPLGCPEACSPSSEACPLSSSHASGRYVTKRSPPPKHFKFAVLLILRPTAPKNIVNKAKIILQNGCEMAAIAARDRT
jgi:hypothetical protein